MQKRLIPGLGQGKYKMSLKHLVIPENKNRFEKVREGHVKTTTKQQHRSQPEGALNGQSWKNLSNDVNDDMGYYYPQNFLKVHDVNN